ncbi:hypothetical protein E6H31_01405 [Candidatus Bathyarchaeota archaeon]|nr:MAG: hypothetical protein E6H31_01405 [Candidatus Bathyarchaeota archaeon]
MKNTVLTALVILAFGALATSILPVFAYSSDPQPGWTYYVVYNQSDGSIVWAAGCSPPPAACSPVLRQGEALVWITDQPALVNQFFEDAHNGKMGNWHVNTTTHAVEVMTPSSIGLASPLQSSLVTQMLYRGILTGLGAIGILLSGIAIKRRHFDK